MIAAEHNTKLAELPADLGTWPFRKARLEFQDRVFARARTMKAIAMAPCATGVGKTYMACNVAAYKYMTGEIDAVAVVAPMGVHRQWIEEAIPECMTSAVRTHTGIWKPGMDLRKHRFLGNEKMRVLAFNIEAFSADSGRAAKALAQYLKSGRVMLILDESTGIKNPRAARTKELIDLAPLASCRAILTGTPITRGIEDLWAQYQFLDPEIIGMSNFYAFRGRYCVTRPAFRGAGVGVVKIVGYRNMEEFVRKIAPVTFVVPKDVLGLPPKTYERINVELTDEQRRAYNALRNKLIDDLHEQRIVSPANAAVRLVRLQQVLCGRLVVNDSDDPEAPATVRQVASRRVSATVDFVEDNPDPYVIWCRFVPDLFDLEKALKKIGRKPVLHYGAMDDEDRAKAKKMMMDGKATDFLASVGISKGLDGLQHVIDRGIYYSGTFNREDRWQSEDRIYRLGTKGSVVFFDVVAGPGKTVDHMIMEVREKTEDLIRDFMSHPDMLPEV